MIDRKAFCDYLRGLDPPARCLGDLEELSAGWESELFAFTLVQDDGEAVWRNHLVLRLYQGPEGGITAQHEFRGMRLLHEAGYPVPAVLWAEPDPSILGRPFLVMERIDGIPAWDPFVDDDLPLFGRIVDLAAGLHELDPAPFAALLPAGADSDPITAQLDLWRRLLDHLGIDQFRPALEWLESRAGSVAPVPPAVVHLDFHPGNVLLGGDGALTVIDWTQVTVSDPRFDLAWSLLLIGTYQGQEWYDRFLRRYDERRGPVADLEFFEAAAATKRLASVAASLLAGPAALGMRPEAAALMRAEMEPTRRVYEVFGDRTGLRIAEIEALLEG